jgi:hypothetical protein
MGACGANKLMILQIAPGGQAVVGGPQLDLSVGKLMALARAGERTRRDARAARPLPSQRPGI